MKFWNDMKDAAGDLTNRILMLGNPTDGLPERITAKKFIESLRSLWISQIVGGATDKSPSENAVSKLIGRISAAARFAPGINQCDFTDINKSNIAAHWARWNAGTVVFTKGTGLHYTCEVGGSGGMQSPKMKLYKGISYTFSFKLSSRFEWDREIAYMYMLTPEENIFLNKKLTIDVSTIDFQHLKFEYTPDKDHEEIRFMLGTTKGVAGKGFILKDFKVAIGGDDHYTKSINDSITEI